jgi:mannose/fructose/N-acetylgalactosamine-specific phosphotransferase system component IID
VSEKWLKDLLKSRGFSNDVLKAIDENVKRDTEEKEMLDREKAFGLTLKMVNEMLPSLKQAMEAEEKRKANMRTIIIPDEK